MNTRLLKLSALVALAYTTTTSASQAESISQPITPTTSEQKSQTQNDAPTADGAAANTLPVIEVSSDRLNGVRNGIQVETGSSSYHISHKDIESLPLGEDSTFNQVLLQAPGVAQDSYGQLHVRGDHANLQYRLNGILLPESISGFGQTLDTHFIDSVNLITGALPAQYGYRTAGIVDIQTKTGQLTPEGNIGIVVGSNNTRQLNLDTSGTVNGINYYLSGSLNANNLGIENPTSSSSPLHDRTVQNKGFGYFSYLINPDTRISLILANTNSRFQIPNTAGETPSYPLPGVNIASANLNETQRETNRYEILSLQGAIGDDIDYQIALFNRYTSVSYQPDTYGDLIYTGVSSQVSRSGLANGLQLDAGYRLNDNHTLRAGLSTTREKLSNSDQSLTLTADADGNPTSTTPISISDSASKVTTQNGIYLQDEWKLTDRLTLNYGARFDQINAYVVGPEQFIF